MKRFFIFLIASAFIMATLTLVACSNDSSDDDSSGFFSGTYKCTRVELEDGTVVTALTDTYNKNKMFWSVSFSGSSMEMCLADQAGIGGSTYNRSASGSYTVDESNKKFGSSLKSVGRA